MNNVASSSSISSSLQEQEIKTEETNQSTQPVEEPAALQESAQLGESSLITGEDIVDHLATKIEFTKESETVNESKNATNECLVENETLNKNGPSSNSSPVSPSQTSIQKRKLVNDGEPNEDTLIPNKILLTGENIVSNDNDSKSNIKDEDELLRESINNIDSVNEQELIITTTNDLKKNICLKKIKQLSDLRVKCIENLDEQYYLENEYAYLNYDKWKQETSSSKSVLLITTSALKKSTNQYTNIEVNKKLCSDFIQRNFNNKNDIFNLEKKLVDKFNLNKPIISSEIEASTSSSNNSISLLNNKKATTSSSNDKQSIAERAKHEAQILQRIAHLRKDGLWSIKRLPKLVEPPHIKTHWDFLLDEMTWMSTDFQQERKWKRNCSRKLSAAILKYFKDKELKEELKEKEETKRLRKQASLVSREIMQFWKNVEKIAEYKQKTILEEKRKQAMDVHLNFIVDQTEKYSSWLMESLRVPLVSNQETQSNSPSTESAQKSKLCDLYDDDTEFDIDNEDSELAEDDESTIEKEEKEEDNDVDDEIRKLQMESDLPFDDLLKDYNLDENYFINNIPTSNKKSDSVNSRSNRLLLRQQNKENSIKNENMETNDDENTSTTKSDIEESKLSGSEKMEMKDEVISDDDDDDEDDGNVEKDGQKDEEEVDEDDDGEYMSDSEEEEDDEETIEQEEKLSDQFNHEDEIAALKRESELSLDVLLSDRNEENVNTTSANPSTTSPTDNNTNNSNQDDKVLNTIAATAQSLQPTGYTLETTIVKTRVPSQLLKHSLREYQHVGLDWLVTMYENKLNGILADEMGLGKTIQTIALLAHLACEKGIWGPHLIVVPTSVMLNWELEFKKWCPGFKILTYYGNPKERRLKRQGWTKVNAFHVCITSYKLVIQDHAAFRRKKWKYFILDEAQNIKNFKSQRWQGLLNFQSQRRLLLTGTPLQNNLMELWSLMHFLMPHVFSSHREFQHWFSNPLKCMIEGNQEYNEQLIRRLHKVLRPFILRRLKVDVEKQMPKKYEHVIRCKLSKRQRLLYEEFMSLSSTKETLSEGRYMSVINILMQLRKVCNHPDLFDPRPIVSSFVCDSIDYYVPSLVFNLNDNVFIEKLNNMLFYQPSYPDTELVHSAFACHRSKQLQTPRRLIEEIMTNVPPLPLKQTSYYSNSTYNLLYSESLNFDKRPVDEPASNMELEEKNYNFNSFFLDSSLEGLKLNENHLVRDKLVDSCLNKTFNDKQALKSSIQYLIRTNRQRCNFFKPMYGTDLQECVGKQKIMLEPLKNVNSSLQFTSSSHATCQQTIDYELNKSKILTFWSQTQALSDILNHIECQLFDKRKNQVFSDILDRFVFYVPHVSNSTNVLNDPFSYGSIKLHVAHPQPSYYQKQKNLIEDITHLVKLKQATNLDPKQNTVTDTLSRIQTAMKTNFPEKRLIQYDCGKLQTLSDLLRNLFAENHRVLIFTQMTRMLDILENFLNYHGHKYLRLDGSTSIEQRQALMERFNNDKRIFCFILSTRSGGIGVNLTGADTVIFYDSDWNPTMDAQAQDRCHRIGQTRDVHIYRLISEKTIEENILKKANQKRLLSDMTIEGGNFTTALLKKHHITELFEEPDLLDSVANSSDKISEEIVQNEKLKTDKSPVIQTVQPAVSTKDNEFEAVLALVEDESDVKAAKELKAEVHADIAEFDENDLTNAENVVDGENNIESSKLEIELKLIENELRPIEKYALKFLESFGNVAVINQEQDIEIDKVKKEWELNRLKQLKEQEELKAEQDEDDMMFTYKKTEVANKKNKKLLNKNKKMNKKFKKNNKFKKLNGVSSKLVNENSSSIKTRVSARRLALAASSAATNFNKNNFISNNANNKQAAVKFKTNKMTIKMKGKTATLTSKSKQLEKSKKMMTKTQPKSASSLIDSELIKYNKLNLSANKALEEAKHINDEKGKLPLENQRASKKPNSSPEVITSNIITKVTKSPPSVIKKIASPKTTNNIESVSSSDVESTNKSFKTKPRFKTKSANLNFKTKSSQLTIRELTSSSENSNSNIKLVNNTINEYDEMDVFDYFNMGDTKDDFTKHSNESLANKAIKKLEVNANKLQKKQTNDQSEKPKGLVKRGRKPKADNTLFKTVLKESPNKLELPYNKDSQLGTNLLDKLNSQIKLNLIQQQPSNSLLIPVNNVPNSSTSTASSSIHHPPIKTIINTNPPKTIINQATVVRTIIRPQAQTINLNIPSSHSSLITNTTKQTMPSIPVIKQNNLPILTTMPLASRQPSSLISVPNNINPSTQTRPILITKALGQVQALQASNVSSSSSPSSSPSSSSSSCINPNQSKIIIRTASQQASNINMINTTTKINPSQTIWVVNSPQGLTNVNKTIASMASNQITLTANVPSTTNKTLTSTQIPSTLFSNRISTLINNNSNNISNFSSNVISNNTNTLNNNNTRNNENL